MSRKRDVHDYGLCWRGKGHDADPRPARIVIGESDLGTVRGDSPVAENVWHPVGAAKFFASAHHRVEGIVHELLRDGFSQHARAAVRYRAIELVEGPSGGNLFWFPPVQRNTKDRVGMDSRYRELREE